MKFVNTNRKEKYLSLINKLLFHPKLKGKEDILSALRYLKTDINSEEYRITVVGEFSTGKSTFLNALIGKDILPHGVAETTATVTYLHNVPESSPLINKVIVHFRDKGKKDITFDIHESSENFIEFVTAKSNRNVVKDIESVDVYIHFMINDMNVVFVDTPGLNGMAEGMRDITLRELSRSNANIFLFGVCGIKNSDKENIKSIYQPNAPYFFVINQIDKLKNESPEKRIESFREDVINNITNGKTDVRVFGVSSFQALVSRDKSIEKLYENGDVLTEQRRSELLPESRFPEFEKNLFEFLESSEREIKFLDEIKKRLLFIFDRAIRDAEFEKFLLQAETNDIPAKKKLEEQAARVEKASEDNKKIITNKVTVRLDDLAKNIKKEIADTCHCEYKNWLNLIDTQQTVEDIDKLMNSTIMPNKVNHFYASVRNETEKMIDSGVQSIYIELVELVASYVPQAKIKDGKQISFEHGKSYNDPFEIERRLNTIEKSLEEKRRELSNEKSFAPGLINSQNNEILRITEELRKEKSAKLEAERRLGNKPVFKKWNETVTYTERRWYTLWLKKHEVTQQIEKNNQSDIDSWITNKSRIENQFSSKINTLEKLISQLQTKVNEAQNKFSEKTKILMEQIARLENQKREEEKEITRLKQEARTTYIRQSKKSLREQLERYAKPSLSNDGGIMFQELMVNITDSIKNIEVGMKQRLEKIYNKLLENFKNNQQKLIKHIDNVYNIDEKKLRIETLSNLIKELSNIRNGELAVL